MEQEESLVRSRISKSLIAAYHLDRGFSTGGTRTPLGVRERVPGGWGLREARRKMMIRILAQMIQIGIILPTY